MAGAFPNISGAYPVRFPYTHTLLIRCGVKSFWSGTSQRYAISGLLNSFKWNWSRINFADLQTIETFWTAQKGAFDSTWSISLVDPSTMAVRSYANMGFNSDDFSYTENPNQWFALSLDAVQTVSEASPPIITPGFGPHNLGGDATNPPYVVSESSWAIDLDGLEQGWLAFDGGIAEGSAWIGTGGGVDWLQIDLGTAQPLGSYGIQMGSLPGFASRAPKNWTMEGSPDGSTWTALDTQTGQTAWGTGELRTFSCAAITTQRYLRLNITANNGDTTFTQVAEMYLYATATPAIIVPSFPNINAGVLVQIPFGTAPSFKTFRNDLDSGKRISWAAWPIPLVKWALSYPAITDAEVKTLVAFYLGAGGPVNPFSFIDPDTGAFHPSCYFGAQGMVLTRISPNVNSLTCAIEEFLS